MDFLERISGLGDEISRTFLVPELDSGVWMRLAGRA